MSASNYENSYQNVEHEKQFLIDSFKFFEDIKSKKDTVFKAQEKSWFNAIKIFGFQGLSFVIYAWYLCYMANRVNKKVYRICDFPRSNQMP